MGVFFRWRLQSNKAMITTRANFYDMPGFCFSDFDSTLSHGEKKMNSKPNVCLATDLHMASSLPFLYFFSPFSWADAGFFLFPPSSDQMEEPCKRVSIPWPNATVSTAILPFVRFQYDSTTNRTLPNSRTVPNRYGDVSWIQVSRASSPTLH